jgi:hypothetical protein
MIQIDFKIIINKLTTKLRIKTKNTVIDRNHFEEEEEEEEELNKKQHVGLYYCIYIFYLFLCWKKKLLFF